LTSTQWQRAENEALFALRLGVGVFLIYGVLDNIVDPARMQEFAEFLAKYDFPAPAWMAPISVWTQFAVGAGFTLGLLTRWAGLLCAIHFAIAIVVVDRFAGIRGAFPAMSLLLIGVYLSTRGAGRYALDTLIEKRWRAP
jgi:putative oxidoreductase